MNRIPFYRAGVLQRIVSYVRQVGAPVGQYLEEARIGADQLEDPEAFVPTVFVFRFIEIAARRAGVADIGLRIGQTCCFSRMSCSMSCRGSRR